MTEWLLTDFHIHTTSNGQSRQKNRTRLWDYFESRGKAVMNYEFVYEENILIIKLSGSAEVNERLSVKQHLVPYLQGPYPKVIVDLKGLDEPGGVYIVGVLNTIKKEFQLLGGEVKFCSLEPGLFRYFEGNRLDQIFAIGQSVESAKQSFKDRNNAS